MAAQAGIGISKLVLLVGAGLTGSVLLKNTRLSDIFSEIQSLLSRLDEGKESSNGASDHITALSNQVKLLQKELRNLPSGPIIVNPNSGQIGAMLFMVEPAVINPNLFAFSVASFGVKWLAYLPNSIWSRWEYEKLFE